MAPFLNPGEQLTAIDARGEVLHPPIVKSLQWPDEEATRRCAAALAGHGALRDSSIELQGELGAGKTTFVRHLLQALGVPGRIKSPTYAVVEPYELAGADSQAPLRIWHFDFYRFADPAEWEDAGFRDIFASPGLKLTEWPDKARAFLPRADLELGLEVLPDGTRGVQLRANTRTGLVLLEAAAA